MRRLVALATVALVAACHSTEPGQRADGTYLLISIDGRPLPVVISDYDSTKVMSGSITLGSNGRWHSTQVDSLKSSATSPYFQYVASDSGFWTLAGSVLSVRTGPTTATALLTGTDINYNDGADQWLYRRQ